jgi:Tol biopolymer transport system component
MLSVLFAAALLQQVAAQEGGLPAFENLRFDGERRLGRIRRLTNSGENAEGYFSFDGTRISYQGRFDGMEADQIFTLDLLTGAREMVSTGQGRTTCSHFLPGDRAVLFASTHAAANPLPAGPDYRKGYVWKIHPEFDLWVRDLESWELKPLAPAPGYDAEAVVSPDGRKIVFTSRRNGDLDLYWMNLDGSGLEQLTDELGYDGGAFFSPDGSKLVYRAFHPRSEEDRARYLSHLEQDEIEPLALQIMTLELASRVRRQVTDNGAANFAPYWHPDGERILYSSNQDGGGRNFDIWMIREDGRGNERITQCPSFDGFPMFSRDGSRLIFASNRAGADPRNTNLFLAEWIEPESGE